MNKKVFILGLGVILGLASCKKEGCTDINANNYDSEAANDDASCIYDSYTITDVNVDGESYKKVTGTIDENITFLAANKYLLEGGVFVGSGATLTIESCTEVFAQTTGATSFLSVLRGGKIDAVGSSNCPIVFKPIGSNPQAGDWGGIIINGRAPINTGTEAQGEGNTGLYGGSNAADNSGTISYVRVEYAGKVLGTDNELNGFSFNGVGFGTSISYIQAYKGSDDGIEFFGGTVNVTYAVSTGNHDDSFDWTHGWSGNAGNWIVEQDQDNGDRGIEADNNGDNNTASPYSDPAITNIHLTLRDSADHKSGIKLREGTKGSLSNIYINGSVKPLDIQHDATLNNVVDGSLSVSSVSVENTITNATFKSSNSNATLEGNASAAGNVVVDGNASTIDTSWKNGWTLGL